jgi:hypothetical protein
MHRLALIAEVLPRTPRRADDAHDQHRLRQDGRDSLGADGHPSCLSGDCLLKAYYRPGVTSTSRLTSSPSRMLATASGGSTIFAFDPSADRTVTSPLLRSMSVILPAS